MSRRGMRCSFWLLGPFANPARVCGLAGLLIGCTSSPDDEGGTRREDSEHAAPEADGQETSGTDPKVSKPDTETPRTVELTALAPYDPIQPSWLDGERVFTAERPPPALSGGTLAVAPDGRVLASDSDRDQVYVIDVATRAVRTIALAPGDEPGRVVASEARAYVGLRQAGALATIDLTSGTVSARTAVCAAPRGIAHDRAGARILVACAGGELVSVSEDGLTVQATRRVTPDLRDVGVDAQGIWVSHFRTPELLRVDDAGNVSARSAPATVRVPPPSSFVTTQTVSFAPTLAWRTVQSAAGALFMVHQRAQVDPVEAQNGYGGTGGFCRGGIVHASVTRFGDDAPAPQPALPEAVVPTDLAVSPGGARVAVVAPGNFARQDAAEEHTTRSVEGSGRGPAQQLLVFASARLDEQRAPGAVLQNGPRDCLEEAPRWEHRFPGEALATVFLDEDTLLVQVREPAELHVFRFDAAGAPRLSAVLELDPRSVRDTGHQVFHQNTGGAIACASCHGEALDDGHTWNFSDVGARRTQHLRGGIAAMAPYHWSGELPTFDALLDEVYVRRMRANSLPLKWRTPVLAWLDRLPLIPTAAHDDAAQSRGRALFEASAVGCSGCHAGEALRSAGRYDVGTGGSFEVPSLRGASLRLPLMHDGCAQTMRTRFDPTCGGGDLHGVTSTLTPAELDDLLVYLESL